MDSVILSSILSRIEALEKSLQLPQSVIFYEPKTQELMLKSNIMIILKKRGIKQSELSRISGIPKQVICDWTAGIKPKCVIRVKRLADCLGVTLDELLFVDLGGRL